MKKSLSIFAFVLTLAVTSIALAGPSPKKKESNKDENKIISRLPDWFARSKVLDGITILKDYKIDDRLNPLYLEEDFNGDGHMDIAVPIRQLRGDKLGFAIIHGKKNDVYIIGAGTPVENGLSDDMSSYDIWKISREKKNEPGLEEKTGNGRKGTLILKNPAISIEKSEVGGGLIYWKDDHYAYFHQTC